MSCIQICQTVYESVYSIIKFLVNINSSKLHFGLT